MRTLALTALLTATAAAAGPVTYLGADEATGGSAAAIVADIPLVHTGQFTDADAKRTAAEQADRVLGDVLAAVKVAAGDPALVIRLNVGVGSADVVGPVREMIHKRFPAGKRPAVTFVVGKLPAPDALVAMDAVAPATGRPDDVKRVGSSGLKPVGGAAAAILPAGRRVFVSGQAEKGASPAEATRNTLASLRATLKWLGRTDADVVQCRAFLSPMSAAADVLKEFDAHFGAGGPPVALVEWQSSLPIEIELVAAAPAEKPGPAVEFLAPPGMTTPTIYSRVARVASDRFIYTAGLTSAKAGTGEEQVADTFERLRGILKEAGGDFKHLAKATYFVADEDASGALNRLRPRYYDPKRPPAASKALVAGVGVKDRTLVLDMIAVPTPK